MNALTRYVLVFSVLVRLSSQSNCLTNELNLSGEEDQEVVIFVTESELKDVVINITYTESNATFSLANMDEDIFHVKFNDMPDKEINSTNDEIMKDELHLGILGLKLGIGQFKIVLTFSDSECELKPSYRVKVLRKPSVIDSAFTYSLLSWMIISYVTMGVKMDLRIIWGKLRRPYGVVTGIICQFGIMPGLAFSVAKILSLQDAVAIGLLIDGSCPGGWLSNVFSLLLDCDFVLSLTMTFCSSFLALGMMPLNMEIYAKPFTSEGLKTPYKDIIMQLGLMLIPVGIGIIILYKFTKMADLCVKLLKPFAAGLIVIALSLGIPSQMFIFQSSWRIYVAAGIFPLIGGITGFSISKITQRNTPEALTIAFETGVQNSLLATTMVKLSYPQPEADLISRVPLLIAILTMIEGTIIVLIYVAMKQLSNRVYQPVVEETNTIKSDEAVNNGGRNGWTKLTQVKGKERKIYIGDDYSSDDNETPDTHGNLDEMSGCDGV
ncbi:ileal sodium/bile acid cotransporter-like [Anneissia japonica]|uniref:ileal sodium/bile acid cotransporter-like n=1 Tax=Anneissia japonica TaxID=1529436 RepID=UPI0014257C34|nr:ileal sodium/bile acid cotransporter-like [Anneissia japonica]